MAVGTRTVTATLMGLCWSWATPAQAQVPAQPATEAHPLVAEFHTGLADPLGRFGLALAYDRGGRFSAGLGLGLDSINRELVMGASLFGRMRLLRLGNFTLDTGAILSRGGHQTSRTYSSPNAAQADSLTWTWSPDYRLTGTLGVGLIGQRWSLRLEGGLGYRLNHPTCTYEGLRTEFQGDCNSRDIPNEYHSSSPPDRLAVSFSLALGYRLGVEDEVAGADSHASPGYRSPNKALRLSAWSTALPIALGGAMLSLAYSNRSDNVTLPVIGALGLGLGLSFGPSIGYAYAGEPLRAWGLGALRALGYGFGSIFIFGAAMTGACEDCDQSGAGTYALVGVTLFGTSLISSIYDIVAAPKAAQRANARHGLSNLSLLPVPIAGSKSVGPGIALGGQF
jgi:hypothetical protein